jgi:CBS domain-containing protein
MRLSKEKKHCVVTTNNTLEEVWLKIEINRHRSVIVIDGNKVVGTLSDGDLRRTMLSRRLLSTPAKEVMNVDFISITKNEKDKAEKIFEAKNIYLLPVVDKEMNLIDIIIKQY